MLPPPSIVNDVFDDTETAVVFDLTLSVTQKHMFF